MVVSVNKFSARFQDRSLWTIFLGPDATTEPVSRFEYRYFHLGVVLFNVSSKSKPSKPSPDYANVM
jgi:hypothetical protein